MRILVVSNMYPNKEYPSYGVFVKNFCDQLDDLNITYEKAIMMKSNNKIRKIFNYLMFYFDSFFKCLFKNYDIIYVHYASHSGLGVILARKLKKLRIFINLHGSDVIPENKKQEKMQFYTNILLGISERIIVPSEYFKNVIIEKYNLSQNKIYIYPSGGIDEKIFFKRESKDKIYQKFNLNQNLLTFGMAGRISIDKGWDTFVDAVEIVLKKGYKANFVIIGDGNQSSILENQIIHKKLEKKITYIKKLINQTELAEYFSAIDWFVFPTKRKGESLGLVAIEAMSCGTPVIASDFAAPKYYIKHRENGYKFKVGDKYALADSIIEAIEGKSLINQENLKITTKNFKRSAVAESLKKILIGEVNDE